jgi:hypothetical protein
LLSFSWKHPISFFLAICTLAIQAVRESKATIIYPITEKCGTFMPIMQD